MTACFLVVNWIFHYVGIQFSDRYVNYVTNNRSIVEQIFDAFVTNAGYLFKSISFTVLRCLGNLQHLKTREFHEKKELVCAPF